MILNANIPLNTDLAIRQPRWRIGVFLCLVATGLLLGWGSAERLFTGIFTPELKTASGISIRVTPEHALWIATHMEGLSLNAACPIDLPSLLSHKTTAWTIFGDTGTEMQTVVIGKIPDTLKNYESAFNCTFTPLKNGYVLQNPKTQTPELSSFFPFRSPDGWAWQNNNYSTLTLFKHGVSIAFSQASQEKFSWPEQTLTTALPLNHASFEVLPETWQGLTNILQEGRGKAYFSWETPEGTADAFSLKGAFTDSELLALFAVITETPITTQKQFRDDNVSYDVTIKEPLTLTWKNSTSGEIQKEDGGAVGYIIKNEDETLVSTVTTTWTRITPHWEAPIRNKTNAIAHEPRTIANFGKRIFITKNTCTIFQEEM